jgi:hypothetical protein
MPTQSLPPSVLTITCLVCDAPFEFARRPGQKGRLPRFCSPGCKRVQGSRLKHQYKAEGRVHRRPDYVPPPKRQREFTCAQCSVAFLSTQSKATCCSRACLSVYTSRVVTALAVAWRKYATKRDKWAAQNYARRAALATAQVELFSPSVVFERDGWLCQLCGQEVDRSLRGPHRLSASLDHIVPVSKGGSHTLSNVQLAHLSCNSRKGARTTPQPSTPPPDPRPLAISGA